MFENAILGYHNDKTISRRGLFSRQALLARTRDFIRQFDIRPDNAQLRVGLLSGGNQQKWCWHAKSTPIRTCC
jgi:simple sugar transport system ATP-binding protein